MTSLPGHLGDPALTAAGPQISFGSWRSAVARDVMSHRMVLGFDAVADNVSPAQVVERIIAMVPAPTPVWNDQQRTQGRSEHRYTGADAR